jgi:hypothetical protein
MLNTKLNTQQGFFPPSLCAYLKNAILPEQVLHHHRNKRRGGPGGQVLSSPSSYPCFVLHIIVQGILQSQITLELIMVALHLRLARFYSEII